ncbi:VOC family protein [Winogradskyella eckloniae]|uniref:VOC family protein n=1 Tax=Winogradskyella eckloniae TaxID=1089306 RepID=UPI0015676C39|nr:VOC family protein [Winogradskyella eckloniae]NRD18434.1 VOC family protein [Winogradskyella eckloniae]
MKYAYTILYVADVEKTLAFYNTAFGFQKKFMTPEHDYGELVSGETTIAFAANELGQSNFKNGFEKLDLNKKPNGIEMAFTTKHIEDDFARAIKAGAIQYEPIIEKPWGQKVGYLRDINGFLIEICTPIKN